MNTNLENIVRRISSSKGAFCKIIARNEVGDTGGHQMGFYVPKDAVSVIFDTPGLRGENKDKFVTIRWNDKIETQSRFIYYGKGTRNEYRITRFGKDFPYLRSNQVGNLFILIKINETDYDAFIINSIELIELSKIYNIPKDKLNTGLLIKGGDSINKQIKKTKTEQKDVVDPSSSDNSGDYFDSEDYSFEPGARAIIQMGEELIGHPTTAVNELVKNSYDADATECRVYFHFDPDTSKSFVVIQDNGLGMEHGTLFGEWLQPSVSTKRGENRHSKIFERNFLGSKGIGRLAVMALGKYLTVVSKTQEEEMYNWLCLDRDKFREETLLSKVKFPGGRIKNLNKLFSQDKIVDYKNLDSNEAIEHLLTSKKLSDFSEGTIIIIEVVDDSVRVLLEDDFKNPDLSLSEIAFFSSLRILITPIELNNQIQTELINRKIIDESIKIANEDSIFSILMGTNLVPELNEKFIQVEAADILSKFDYRIMGKVEKNGAVTAIYDCSRLESDMFSEKFELTSEESLSQEFIQKRKTKKLEATPENRQSGEVGEFLFDIRVYDRDLDSMEKMGKVLKTQGKRATGQTLDKLLGLRISKNGFGVKPYGSEDKDWMNLGQMRVQNPTATLGTNQILGNIFLHSPINDGLSEKTNREGFFENEAFITFKKILRAVLLEAGKRRYRYRVKHAIGRSATSKLKRPDSAKFLSFIKQNSDDEKLISKAKKFIDETNTSMENMENSLTFSQRLASLGSGLELVYHELAQPITQLGGASYNVKVYSNKIVNSETRNPILDEIRRMDSAVSFLDDLKESLQPAIGKSMPTNFSPIETFKKVCSLFVSDFAEENIEIKYGKDIESLMIKGFEYIFWISFLNIINNAVYWLKQEKNTKKKLVTLNLIQNGLSISNSGPRIPEGDIEAIFEYGVTLKKEKNATGLGLAYTRNMLSSIDWDIEAENTKNGPVFRLTKNKLP